MRKRRLALGLGLALHVALAIRPASAAAPQAGTSDPSQARASIIEALSKGRPGLLEPLLPSNAKVHLSLRTIGPARGLYGGGQLVVLLEEFFSRCQAQGFDASPPEGEAAGSPVNLHGTVSCHAAEGNLRVQLHLVLELSGDRWRLSEVWETG